MHSQCVKAWIPTEAPRAGTLLDHAMAAYLDASPYTVLAANLWPMETISWTKPRTRLGAALRAVGFRYPALTGFPIAVAVDIIRLGLCLARGSRRKPQQFLPGGADLPGPA